MGGVKTEHGFVIYKCNKYPITYFRSNIMMNGFQYISRQKSRVMKWLFRAYIAWSICADMIILGGVIYLLFR